jgi:hypothetical protein
LLPQFFSHFCCISSFFFSTQIISNKMHVYPSVSRVCRASLTLCLPVADIFFLCCSSWQSFSGHCFLSLLPHLSSLLSPLWRASLSSSLLKLLVTRSLMTPRVHSPVLALSAACDTCDHAHFEPLSPLGFWSTTSFWPLCGLLSCLPHLLLDL